MYVSFSMHVVDAETMEVEGKAKMKTEMTE